MWDDGTAFNFSALSPVLKKISVTSDRVVMRPHLNGFFEIETINSNQRLVCSKNCVPPTTCYKFATTPYRRISAAEAENICAALSQTEPMLKSVDRIREFVRWFLSTGNYTLLNNIGFYDSFTKKFQEGELLTKRKNLSG